MNPNKSHKKFPVPVTEVKISKLNYLPRFWYFNISKLFTNNNFTKKKSNISKLRE